MCEVSRRADDRRRDQRDSCTCSGVAAAGANCPEAYGPATTIYKPLRTLGAAWAGIWEKPVSGSLPGMDDPQTRQMIDSTHIKSPTARHRGGKKGGAETGCWPPRAGGRKHEDPRTRRMLKGRLIAILLTGGEGARLPGSQERLILPG